MPPLYEFRCAECGNVMDEIFKYEERPKTVPCTTQRCEGDAEYHVANPGMLRLQFTQNGRIGYKYDMGDGKQTHRSATRENYEHNIMSKPLKDVQGSGSEKAKSVLSKEYQRHVNKTEKEKVDKAKYLAKERKKC